VTAVRQYLLPDSVLFVEIRTCNINDMVNLAMVLLPLNGRRTLKQMNNLTVMAFENRTSRPCRCGVRNRILVDFKLRSYLYSQVVLKSSVLLIISDNLSESKHFR
jgi:hypothetical protein